MQGLTSKEGKKSIMGQIGFFIFAGVVAMFVLLFMIIVMISVKKIRDKIKNILEKAYQKFVFNGAIRSITLVFIKFAIAFGFQIELILKRKTGQISSDNITGLIMFIIMIGYLVMSIIVILWFKKDL
jgi:hypothetical protein